MFRIANDAQFGTVSRANMPDDPITDIAGYERTLERMRHYLKGDEAAFEFGCGTGTTALKTCAIGRAYRGDRHFR